MGENINIRTVKESKAYSNLILEQTETVHSQKDKVEESLNEFENLFEVSSRLAKRFDDLG